MSVWPCCSLSLLWWNKDSFCDCSKLGEKKRGGRWFIAGIYEREMFLSSFLQCWSFIMHRTMCTASWSSLPSLLPQSPDFLWLKLHEQVQKIPFMWGNLVRISHFLLGKWSGNGASLRTVRNLVIAQGSVLVLLWEHGWLLGTFSWIGRFWLCFKSSCCFLGLRTGGKRCLRPPCPAGTGHGMGLIPSPSLSQHICLDCKKNFCTSCSNQPEGGPLLCHLCQRFRATAFQREELIKMKVKDLRDYLALHEISTEFCREKEDLVFLILGQQPAITQEDQIRTNTFNTSAHGQQDFVSHPPTSLASSTSQDESSVSADPISSSEAQEHQQVQSLARTIFCKLIHLCFWINYWDVACGFAV